MRLEKYTLRVSKHKYNRNLIKIRDMRVDFYTYRKACRRKGIFPKGDPFTPSLRFKTGIKTQIQ